MSFLKNNRSFTRTNRTIKNDPSFSKQRTKRKERFKILEWNEQELLIDLPFYGFKYSIKGNELYSTVKSLTLVLKTPPPLLFLPTKPIDNNGTWGYDSPPSKRGWKGYYEYKFKNCKHSCLVLELPVQQPPLKFTPLFKWGWTEYFVFIPFHWSQNKLMLWKIMKTKRE